MSVLTINAPGTSQLHHRSSPTLGELHQLLGDGDILPLPSDYAAIAANEKKECTCDDAQDGEPANNGIIVNHSDADILADVSLDFKALSKRK